MSVGVCFVYKLESSLDVCDEVMIKNLLCWIVIVIKKGKKILMFIYEKWSKFIVIN